MEIRALDSAASFEMEAIRGRCEGSSQADPEAEAAALRAAHIHRTRIGLARQRAGAGGEEVVALAFQAADAYQKAFACNPRGVAHLAEARDLLAGVRAELPDPRAGAAQATDRRIAELAALIEGAARTLRAETAKASVPTVKIVTVEAEVRPGPRDTYLGRLSLRLEPGAAWIRAGGPPFGLYQRGPSGRIAFLARYPVSERVRLLFGPAFAFARLTDVRRPQSGLLVGDVSTFRIGAQFEVQWTPSRRAPWLSLDPFIEIGFELQRYAAPADGTARRAIGVQGGGGLAVCIWHASICPLVRALSLPVGAGQYVVTLQTGLGLDIMRWIDLGVSRGRARN